MSDPYVNLDAAFVARLKALLAGCQAVGTIMRPYFGVRDPVTQGKLWRQSRDTATVDAMITSLRAAGANFLADCIENAGPSSGPWATNAVPGNSWHQYGEAMDCVWLRNGVENWDTQIDGDKNGYQVYMHMASTYGLTAIGLTMGKDDGHVQLRPQGAPHDLFGWPDIDRVMRAKFP